MPSVKLTINMWVFTSGISIGKIVMKEFCNIVIKSCCYPEEFFTVILGLSKSGSIIVGNE